MLSKIHRFHGYGSIKGVYQRGNNYRGPLMTLKVSNRATNRPFRVAVVVSKKVSKSAVVRNRIRRRIYEAVRTMPDKNLPGKDMIFTVHSDSLASVEDKKLKKDVTDLIEKALQN
ncbi:MAG: ribonuclease P protein component [bacterium]